MLSAAEAIVTTPVEVTVTGSCPSQISPLASATTMISTILTDPLANVSIKPAII
jgi:hypothetical protein